MKRLLHCLAACLLLLATLQPAHAIGGRLVTKAGAEALEAIARAVGREATEEGAQIAATKLAKQFGSEAAELAAKYGDDFFRIVRNGNRAKVFVKSGATDDAARALIKHGKAAEDVLDAVPGKQMAKALQGMSHQEARQVNHLVNKGLTASDRTWLASLGDNAASALNLAARHPYLTAAVGITALWAWNDHQSLLAVAETAVETATWCLSHPVWTVAILLLLGVLYVWAVRLLQRSPFLILNWLGRKLGRLLPRKVRQAMGWETAPSEQPALDNQQPGPQAPQP